MATRKTVPPDQSNYLFGIVIVALVIAQIWREFTDSAMIQYTVVGLFLLAAVSIALRLRGIVWLFPLTAIALSIAEIMIDPTWRDSLWRALLASGLYVAFFSALTTLKNAASGSAAISRAGSYLASQPPGRRYFALTVGAQVFALLLNYGSIQLLGALSTASAGSEPDERIRRIRTRRMLLAIHRGFISSLSWSPLSFAIAISVAVIPGTSWAQIAVPGAVTSLIIIGTGWAMDSIFKPAVAGRPRPVSSVDGRWTDLIPLAILLVLMLSLLALLSNMLSIRVIGLVLMIIPGLSLAWIVLQLGGFRGSGDRLSKYIGHELPSYRKEILLIATAGYIGATGADLLGPFFRESGIDLAAYPTWAILMALIWILPILGQIGANPILSLSLIGPLLPSAESLGITPTALVVAIISGWTMTGITSPFTATNLLIGRFGGLRAIDVGWVWNRSYFLVTITLLCVWSLLFAFVFSR